MKNNKVIAQLTLFSDNEMKLFGKYLSNPHFNKKEAVIRLHKFVAKNHPAYEKQKFSKRKCFLYVFPELKPELAKLNGKADAFISSKLKNPLYDLKKLINEFIIQQEFEEESHEKTITLIKGLFKRKMHDKAFELIDKELKQLESTIGEDLYRFQLLDMKQDYTLEKIKNNDGSIFVELTNSLDVFYVTEKLRIENIIKNRNSYLNSINKKAYSNNINSLIGNYQIDKMPKIIELYCKLLDLSKAFEIESFQTVKNFYYIHFEEFSLRDKTDINTILFNYCIDGNKAGTDNYLKEAFEIMRFKLKNKLFEGECITSTDFTNLIVISTSLYKFGWASSFVNKYSKHLPEDRRESMTKISMAQIEGAKPDCDYYHVIELLRNVEYFNAYDNIQARSIMMRAYYMLEEWPALEYFLDSFYKFVKRNKSISNEVKLSIVNMIKFTRVLMNAKSNKTTKTELVKKFNGIKPIYAKKWFTNRINDLVED